MFGFGCFIPFIVANMFEMFDVIALTASLMFMGLSLIIIAKSIYLTAIADKYAKINREPRDISILKLFLMSYMLINISTIFGAAILTLGLRKF